MTSSSSSRRRAHPHRQQPHPRHLCFNHQA
jgi:hypothetical protein